MLVQKLSWCILTSGFLLLVLLLEQSLEIAPESFGFHLYILLCIKMYEGCRKMYWKPGNIFSVYVHDVYKNFNCSQHSERQSWLSSLIFILKVCLENMLIMTPRKWFTVYQSLPNLIASAWPLWGSTTVPTERNPFQAARREPNCSRPLSPGRHQHPQHLDKVAALFILVLSLFSLPYHFIQLLLTSFLWQCR